MIAQVHGGSIKWLGYSVPYSLLGGQSAVTARGVNGYNPASGRVTVHYDHERHSTGGILRLLEDLDVVVESLGHLPTIEGQESEGGDRLETKGFLAAVDDLNRLIV